jgi:type-F conjugative transfer system pilin assembly thiol-disulfide isomerase TrbB
MRVKVILLLCFFYNISYANVALDQLNARLAAKSAVSQKANIESPLIKEISEHYYFAFIYRGDCPHCHNFAPILTDFANTFHVEVKAYHIDSKTLDGLNNQPLTPELFQTFYASGGYRPIVPALFLVNRDTLEAYAVLFGEAAPHELAKRVDELMQHIQERFNA